MKNSVLILILACILMAKDCEDPYIPPTLPHPYILFTDSVELRSAVVYNEIHAYDGNNNQIKVTIHNRLRQMLPLSSQSNETLFVLTGENRQDSLKFVYEVHFGDKNQIRFSDVEATLSTYDSLVLEKTGYEYIFYRAKLK